MKYLIALLAFLSGNLVVGVLILLCLEEKP